MKVSQKASQMVVLVLSSHKFQETQISPCTTSSTVTTDYPEPWNCSMFSPECPLSVILVKEMFHMVIDH
jgi:hypothetical protein